MAARKLNRAEWKSYCDRVSKSLDGDNTAEIEVVSLGLGDRIETRWLPLFGLTYDPRSDVFEIALDGVDHLIANPQEVNVEETSRGIVAFEIAIDDETRQTVRFRE